MGLLAVLNLKQIDIAQPVVEPERADRGKGGGSDATAPKPLKNPVPKNATNGPSTSSSHGSLANP